MFCVRVVPLANVRAYEDYHIFSYNIITSTATSIELPAKLPVLHLFTSPLGVLATNVWEAEPARGEGVQDLRLTTVVGQ